jgi:septum site-determining protein MinD
MGRIISFVSGKGGVGKTLVVANLGTAAAQLGKKTVILDADIPMANLGLMLGLETKKATLHEVLAGEAKISRAIYNGPGGVKVVPSGMSLDGLRKIKPGLMEEVVKSLAKRAEIVLIDGPSGLGRDALSALRVSKELVIVVTPDIASLSDALKTKIVAEHLNVKPIGAIVTRTVSKKMDIPQEKIKSLLELPILAIVPEDPETRRSVALGKPVVTHKPKSEGAKVLRELAKKLFGGKKKKR